MRISIDVDPFSPDPIAFQQVPWRPVGVWPCSWIAMPEFSEPGCVAYRCQFNQPTSGVERIHVSGDERYALFLDGVRVGRGPERGDGAHWAFESYDLELTEGPHTFVALVWSYGRLAPGAQMSVRHGLLFAPEGVDARDRLGTGIATWTARALRGHGVRSPGFVGPDEVIDAAAYPWGVTEGAEDSAWGETTTVEPAWPAAYGQEEPGRHLLVPASLPAMVEEPIAGLRVRHVDAAPILAPASKDALTSTPIRTTDALCDEAAQWQALVDAGDPLTVPAGTTRRVLIDLDDYYCFYPEIQTLGGDGAHVQLEWAESLFFPGGTSADPDEVSEKGNRDHIEGKVWKGYGDAFNPDGGARCFAPLWWRSGRYVMVSIETAADPVTIRALQFVETRYPLEQEGSFDGPEERFTRVWPIMRRGLQMCAHETYMDCPYYEQLMYVGDTRLEALTTFVLTQDARLPRKAVLTLSDSRLANGLTQSRYPARYEQRIPPFSLWWICMVRDYAWWRDDPATVKAVMPGVRAVVEYFASLMDEAGLLRHPLGWNFVDWVNFDENWECGVPDDRGHGIVASVQWQWVHALAQTRELEDHFGSPEGAARCAALLASARKACERFWSAPRGLYAESLELDHFSEHANCLAITSGVLDAERLAAVASELFGSDDLAPASIYFSHYYLEAARAARRPDAFHARLEEWYALPDQGFRTTRESPEPSRSDCHGWGAHPIFHAYATVLGIRPDSPGFRSVRIDPMPGPWSEVRGEMPHPQGMIRVSLCDDTVEVDAPAGVRVLRG